MHYHAQLNMPRMYSKVLFNMRHKANYSLLIHLEKSTECKDNNAHRWDFEICALCSSFCSSVFMIISRSVPDGAPGWWCDAGARQQPGEGYCGHHQQCLPSPMGRLTYLPEGWKGSRVQFVPIQHPLLPAGLWAPGEADPQGRDTPGGETYSRNLYAPNIQMNPVH